MRGTMWTGCLLIALMPMATRADDTVRGDIRGAVQALQSNQSADRAMAMAMLNYAGPKAEGYSQLIVQGLFDKSPDVSGTAAKALGAVNPNLAGPVLTLYTNQNEQAQLAALAQLQKLGANGAAALPMLTNFLDRASPDAKVATIATLGTTSTSNPQVATLIANLALNPDSGQAVRKAAIESLGKMEAGSSTTSLFLDKLKTGTPASQQLAIEALGTLGKNNKEVAAALKKAAATDPSPKVREALGKISSEIEKPKTAPVVPVPPTPPVPPKK